MPKVPASCGLVVNGELPGMSASCDAGRITPTLPVRAPRDARPAAAGS